jgi:hydrogenase maturation protein HypF
VQGVGFRPTVYRYAREAGLGGFVTNDSSGVVIEIEGPEEACEGFTSRLRKEPPPAAMVRHFRSTPIPVRGEDEFTIRPSASGAEAYISIPPDLDVCADCLREMRDPRDRRHRYPFTNCTNCGPRFTITRAMPYDRPQTTMSSFPMCPDCAREYEDPIDRRFHAQPVACPECGPRVWLEGEGLERADGEDAIAAARRVLAGGGILAVRGLGGFHLSCSALDAEAVRLLRERKKRPAKPFALMCPDLAAAEKLVNLSAAEREELTSVRRPILLAAARDVELRETVSPGNGRLGVMLPYTPLHHLLFEPAGGGEEPPRFEALVMTSGNRRDEPICRSNDEARRRLSGIADAWLLHDREIHNRADDSIVLFAAGAPRPVRRARGFVPRPVAVPRSGGPTVLGLGGEMKGAFCLLRGNQAYTSQYLGELDEPGNVEFYREALSRFIELLGEPPAVLAHDLHPDYFTTQLARAWPATLPGADLPAAGKVLAVQHHYAHALSVLAEMGEEAPERCLAVILDGVGWGTDGTAWGGEFLLLEGRGARWRRLAHLQPFELPGGDFAVREPWRQALALCRRAFEEKIPDFLLRRLEESAGGPRNLEALEIMIRRGLNSPLSSGAGRLFDAVGYLVAGRERISFEAQAAMEVEALAVRAGRGTRGYSFEIRKPLGDVPVRLDPAPVIREVAGDLDGGRPREEIAAGFHAGLAAGCADLAARLAEENDVREVVLSGGCFQNALLLETLVFALEARGLGWYANRRVPTNDGGVALGQVLAAVRSQESA